MQQDLLEEGRRAYQTCRWIDARDALAEVRGASGLGADDLYALANAHWWLGELDAALPLMAEAHNAFLAEDRPALAGVVAIDTGYTCALRGDEAQANGWMGRAVRLLKGCEPCAEQGYLSYLAFEEALAAGDHEQAMIVAQEVHEHGRRFGDRNLAAMGVLGQGRALVKQGHVAEGMALLDEAMVAAVHDHLEPNWAGNIYCHLMATCYELADWRRAGEWTEVTARWCDGMPGAGPFMGICRVHRAQVLQASGDWAAVEDEVRRVREELTGFHVTMVGEADYHLGDVCRQRGDLAGAAAAFERARQAGVDPQPGAALLAVAQGDPSAGVAALDRALAATSDPLTQARHLAALVEVALAAGSVDRAAAAAGKLETVAERFGVPGLAARAAHALGAVELAQGRPASAVLALEEAQGYWNTSGATHEAACSQLLLADAHAAAGDGVAAHEQARAARATLARLGTTEPVVTSQGRADGLSAREAEVLDLVAEGCTNQEIAQRLSLSVRTVERHLVTVYRKLGLEGRNARAAAVRHALSSRV